MTSYEDKLILGKAVLLLRNATRSKETQRVLDGLLQCHYRGGIRPADLEEAARTLRALTKHGRATEREAAALARLAARAAGKRADEPPVSPEGRALPW